MPARREVQLLVARELGERVNGARPLAATKRPEAAWATRARAGPPCTMPY